MTSLTRRDLMGAAIAGMGTTALGMGVRNADAAQAASQDDNDTEEELGIEQIKEILCNEVDVPADIVLDDGTVIPAIYVRLRNRINRIAGGVGGELSLDTNYWGAFMELFTPEDAEHFCEMPMFEYFTADDYAALTGRTEDECSEICESMADRGCIGRVRHAGVGHYFLLPFVHGLFEMNMDRYRPDMDTFSPDFCAQLSTVFAPDCNVNNDGLPVYRVVPVDADVVAGGQVLPYDDYKAVIERNEVLAVSPCQCRTLNAIGGDDCGHPRETCLTTGEMAQFYIERGIGRQIDREEALEILARSVDEGLVVQSLHTKASEVICQCHSDCCGMLGSYRALGEGRIFEQVNQYTLELDKEACVRCGACVERCPMLSVSIGEDGYPQMDAACVRCGQCAMVCPAGARTLVPGDVEGQLDLPKDIVDSYFEEAAYRVTELGVTFDNDFVG